MSEEQEEKTVLQMKLFAVLALAKGLQVGQQMLQPGHVGYSEAYEAVKVLRDSLEKKEAVTRNTAVLQDALKLLGKWEKRHGCDSKDWKDPELSQETRKLLSEHDGQPESATEVPKP